jgi:D-glucosaminate-6-phosphate ammonia-lyase
MRDETIYDELGVPSVINAAGTKTRIGGSLIRPEAVEAMSAAAESFVLLSDLQSKACRLISNVTGAEAGFVTSGAAAGLMLSAAAVLAGDDFSVMAQLPETEEIPNEIVMPRTHRTGYDHAFRAAGAEIVDIGTNDHYLGTGTTNVEPWELETAITEQTAAVGYIEKPYTQPPLETVCAIAHENDTPVIVDAAAELPPTTHLSRFISEGADLVVFSGGKAIRGPQTTGIVAGRKDLIESIALQTLDMHVAGDIWDPSEQLIDIDHFDGVPRQGIGRPLKVGKEELAGLITALELFIEEDIDEQRYRWKRRAEHINDYLTDIDGFDSRIDRDNGSIAPEVVVTIDASVVGTTATELARTLRAENPRVFVGTDHLHRDEIGLNTMCIENEQIDYLLDRIVDNAGIGTDTTKAEFTQGA